MWEALYRIDPQWVINGFIIGVAVMIIKRRLAAISSGAPSKTSRRDGSKKDGVASPKEPEELKDVFSALRRRKKTTDAGTAGKKEHEDKPFGSSYYYAHNTPSAAGGYKDGLRTEDYVMNKPRLLSKGGKPIDDDPPETEPENSGAESSTVGVGDSKSGERETEDSADGTRDTSRASGGTETGANKAQVASTNDGTKPSPTSLPVNRYMWDDDPGDAVSGVSEVAKIYIDTLPGRLSTAPPLKWEGAGIKKADVDAVLVGDDGAGLLVRIRRPAAKDGDPKEYHLYIAKMFGVAESVKTIVKSKRLIVKITKKRSRFNPWDKTNLKPWPHLGEKPVGSKSGDGGDAGYIDEDLFKRDINPGAPGGFNEDLFSSKK